MTLTDRETKERIVGSRCVKPLQEVEKNMKKER